MKIAVATFGSRVSPRFDCAGAFYFGTVGSDGVTATGQLRTDGLSPQDRIRLLVEQDVDALICGAIDEASAQQIGMRGITLYSWISGNVEDSLRSLQRGELEPGMMMGSGGRCRGRWRMRRQRNTSCEHFGMNKGGYKNARRRSKRPQR